MLAGFIFLPENSLKTLPAKASPLICDDRKTIGL